MKLFGGIEAGGTKFVCAIGSGPHDIRYENVFPTSTPDETINNAVAFFKSFTEREAVSSIGIGSFGPVDPNPSSETYGYITSTPKPGWANVDIAGRIKQALGVPVAFDTDVNAAALGEYRWGSASGIGNFVYLTVGTGIGGGAFVNGKILHGMTHPEMGHILIPFNTSEDTYEGFCPFHGHCLEGVASGPAMEKRWGMKAEMLPDDHGAWDLESEYLALALVNFCLTLSPEKIIMGGGVMNRRHIFPLIREKFRMYMNKYVQTRRLDQLDEYIVPPGLGNKAGVLGCIAMAESALS